MDFKNVVVAGGGVLGSQIALQCAYKGFNVTIWLRTDASIDRAQPKLQRFRDIYLATLEAMKTDQRAYARGLADDPNLTPEAIDQLKEQASKAYESLTLTTSLEEALKDADLVIEAIAEDPKQKIDFYTKATQYLPERTVLCTNSSTLVPSAFAECTGRPEKYLALHFANEIWRNNTAEVMGHPETEQTYYNQVVEFAKAIGMVPLCLKKEQPGYLLNSLLVPFLSAAQALAANDVADIETIDKTWKLGTGAPFGPFQILDIVGLTTAYNIVSMSPEANDPTTTQGKIKAMLESYIQAGKLGINSGEGFYKYN